MPTVREQLGVVVPSLRAALRQADPGRPQLSFFKALRPIAPPHPHPGPMPPPAPTPATDPSRPPSGTTNPFLPVAVPVALPVPPPVAPTGPRDFVVIVDRSGSMWLDDRWAQASQAVAFLAPYVTALDPDGITLFFFDSTVTKYEHVSTPDRVREIFGTEEPNNQTDLGQVLRVRIVVILLKPH
jgi:hypothetical protein